MSSNTDFPKQLFDLLGSGKHITLLDWLPDGSGVIFFSRKAFGAAVPKIFGSRCSYRAFTKKMNRYGFKRVSNGPDKKGGVYCHPCFIRGRRDLLSKVVHENCGPIGENGESYGTAAGTDRKASLRFESSLQHASRSFSDRDRHLKYNSARLLSSDVVNAVEDEAHQPLKKRKRKISPEAYQSQLFEKKLCKNSWSNSTTLAATKTASDNPRGIDGTPRFMALINACKTAGNEPVEQSQKAMHSDLLSRLSNVENRFGLSSGDARFDGSVKVAFQRSMKEIPPTKHMANDCFGALCPGESLLTEMTSRRNEQASEGCTLNTTAAGFLDPEQYTSPSFDCFTLAMHNNAARRQLEYAQPSRFSVASETGVNASRQSHFPSHLSNFAHQNRMLSDIMQPLQSQVMRSAGPLNAIVPLSEYAFPGTHASNLDNKILERVLLERQLDAKRFWGLF